MQYMANKKSSNTPKISDNAIAIILAAVWLVAIIFAVVLGIVLSENVRVAKHYVIGSGGYGAVLNAKIDPFDEDCYAFTCDMGSAYFSYDAGESFSRHNFQGTCYDLRFDETANGVVWVVGSGVYKSTDHGKSFSMVFPKASEVTSAGHNYENGNYWIFDEQGVYPSQYQVWSMCINRKSGGKNVYVAVRCNAIDETKRVVKLYETNDGENFHFFTDVEYSYNFKLDYDETNDCVIVVLSDKIIELNKNGEIAHTVDKSVFLHHRGANTLAFDSCYDPDTGKNTFVFSTTETSEHCDTVCYMTNDLRDQSSYIDLTEQLISRKLPEIIDDAQDYEQDLNSYSYYEWIDGKRVLHEFPWTICNISVLSDDVVYLYHEARITLSNGFNRRTLAYLKYDKRKADGERFKWVFGFPHKGVNTEVNASWQDGDSGYCYGFSSTPKNENALLFGTIVGLYHTNNCSDVRQLHSTVLQRDMELTAVREDGFTETISPVMRTTTTGVDVYCTHRVATDPFDKNHILMGCTDFGLLQSFDDGESWIRLLRGWNGDKTVYTDAAYRNTCYDLHFDKERQGVVYSIWSNKQTAPYAPDKSYLVAHGKFAVSYDGGTSWKYISIVKDDLIIPYRMQVEYDGDNRIIYIASENRGFFVSRDGGNTFEPMNDGIEPSYILGKENPCIFGNDIIKCDMGIFAITGASASYFLDKKLYKWNEGAKKFDGIDLPESIAAVRDIEYDRKNNCLYLAAIAKSVNNYTAMKFDGGGVWKYKDGEFTQIYDPTVSVFGVNVDSSGRLYATVMSGAVVRFKNNNTEYETLIDGLFHSLKNISFGATDDILYVTSWGGGTEKIVLR